MRGAWLAAVMALAPAACGSSPTPAPADTSPTPSPSTTTLAEVKDMFSLAGMGPGVFVHVARGGLATGMELELVGFGPTTKVTVARVESEGADVGLVLRGVELGALARGQVLATPGSIAAHAGCDAEITLLTRDAGGRATPIASNYKPLVKIHGGLVGAVVILLTGIDQLAPGATGAATLTFDQPVALEAGTTFDLTEGGRTVGRGRVTTPRD